jgi:hypothetical protein
MLTRRELLMSVAGAPFVQALPARHKDARPGIWFYEELHALAEESARGFRSLLSLSSSAGSPAAIIAPAVRNLRQEIGAVLLEHVRRGAWLLFESGVCFSSDQEHSLQARTLKQAFGLEILPSLRVVDIPKASSKYVNYAKPLATSVRSFHAVTPIQCPPSNAIAYFHEHIVGATRAIGKGRLVYLGSMLGPGLLAEEYEAQQVGEGLIGWLEQPR